MTILVTRPGESGLALTQALSARGRAAIYAPLLTFSAGRELNALPAAFHRLQADDVIIAVSGNAVRYAQQALQQIGASWPQVQYAAIGRSTAHALQQASGQPVLFPAHDETSEGLLQMITAQAMAGRHVLILRGNGGRPLLADTFTTWGSFVTLHECYQRQPIDLCGEQLTDIWQRANVNILLVTSGEILQQLVALIPKTEHDWLTSCRLVVVSKRIAAMAQALGWAEIVVSPHADNLSLIAAVEQFE
ncbi:MAG: uroporphyrinogen-III synthase [Plesiomonas sp.]|uniref:uroporphyrinogen-III synthase n=1 Tax=Plesiomonas sp. TaxID=2486279 RepID=UPI003F40AD47